ncbi:HNH endonuclease [Laspinema sp. C3]|uniref:HNH endonuclease n=1 Tax=Laspinema olomoucense D3b TaxID=2953688 RepID=A0ABT2NFS0_9CYAN|nr:HNH endonuclease signature motif containing protein [Laspinema sp. D3b]MCT7981392.1 HNH endonuclease [Laspinema sp. D3b]
MEVDHKIPLSQGGKDEWVNLQLLHRHCHHEKTATDGSQPAVIDKGIAH